MNCEKSLSALLITVWAVLHQSVRLRDNVTVSNNQLGIIIASYIKAIFVSKLRGKVSASTSNYKDVDYIVILNDRGYLSQLLISILWS
jgi:hypothetical protein